mmetsp:Transcript_12126/g.34352  ORF Transcript_12126/g.34352 Transcript_12126/m.34352 type:complete len:112 (+) Transcript_12126:353-688(+)
MRGPGIGAGGGGGGDGGGGGGGGGGDEGDGWGVGTVSKSHCGYWATFTQDSSSRYEPSNFSNLDLQHPGQFAGPVDTHEFPRGDGDRVWPPTLTNFQRWRPLPSSFLASFR